LIDLLAPIKRSDERPDERYSGLLGNWSHNKNCPPPGRTRNDLVRAPPSALGALVQLAVQGLPHLAASGAFVETALIFGILEVQLILLGLETPANLLL